MKDILCLWSGIYYPNKKSKLKLIDLSTLVIQEPNIKHSPRDLVIDISVFDFYLFL